jgi:hypothetical protein
LSSFCSHGFYYVDSQGALNLASDTHPFIWSTLTYNAEQL